MEEITSVVSGGRGLLDFYMGGWSHTRGCGSSRILHRTIPTQEDVPTLLQTKIYTLGLEKVLLAFDPA